MIDAAHLNDFLDGREVRNGQYVSRCPICTSGSETLYYRDGHTGTVIECKVGCDKKELLSYYGLSMKDLFPNTETYVRPPYNPSDDLMNAKIIKAALKKGETWSDSDLLWASNVKDRLQKNGFLNGR